MISTKRSHHSHDASYIDVLYHAALYILFAIYEILQIKFMHASITKRRLLINYETQFVSVKEREAVF